MLIRHALLCITLLLCSSRVSFGQDRFQAALDTGEFALALQAADGEDQRARQDALTAIAAAQVDAGELRPAQFVLAQLQDDAPRGGGDFAGGGPRNGPGGAGGALNSGGGGAQADFDTLINLITTTVEPDTWEELGGEGAIAAFPGGVYVDPSGLLQVRETDQATAVIPDGWASVSLPRLDRALRLSRVVGQPPSDGMRSLGGIANIELLILYPETGDLVIAGPAVAAGDTGLRLEDLLVVMHHAFHNPEAFGCSIDPRQQNLAATQRFLDQSARSPLKPGQRAAWVSSVADQMGRQDVTVFGLDPDTTTAAALVEADHHMKLVGLGLAGDTGIPSYLELIDGAQSLDLVRWWFTLGYDAIEVGPEQTTFKLIGNPVKLISEQELMDATGRRTTTGATSESGRRYTEEFNANFDRLANQYPVYRRLRGIFQLATIARLIRSERLADRINWEPTELISLDGAIRTTPATAVDTLVNHKVIDGTQIVLVASGGVRVDPTALVGELNPVPLETHREQKQRSAPQGRRGPDETWSW